MTEGPQQTRSLLLLKPFAGPSRGILHPIVGVLPVIVLGASNQIRKTNAEQSLTALLFCTKEITISGFFPFITPIFFYIFRCLNFRMNPT